MISLWVTSARHRVGFALSVTRFPPDLRLFCWAGIDQSLGLWREVAQDDVIPQGPNAPNIHVRQGDRIFVDLQKLHGNVRFLAQ
jgi:hypothetical protein